MRKLISSLSLFLCTVLASTVFTALPASSQCSTANPAGCACPTPGATNCVLLPDIIAGKRTLNSSSGYTEFGQLISGVDKGLLRLDISTPNIGWGPLEVAPTNDYVCGGDTLRNFTPPANFLCPDGSYPKRLIKQRVYQKVGNSFQYILRDAGWMQFHPSHGHIHIEGWGLYTLRLRDPSITDTLKWPVVNSGIKVSFCLIDLTTCNGALGDCIDANGTILTNSSFPNYGLGGGYDCGQVKQGISVGKVDIYHQYLDESFIRIPYEACNGDYHVVIQIDPDNHFQEVNENNNWLEAAVSLTKQRSTGTGAYSYIFSPHGNIMCTGESLELQAAGASNYVWSTGETTQEITITDPGKYWVRSTTPCGIATSDTLLIQKAPASSIPTVIREDTVCIGENANLYASGNAHWFDAPVNGNLIFIGNDFQTGNLNSSTTFYVADQPSELKGKAGPVATNFSGAGNYSTLRSEYLIFNAFLPFKLKKVRLDAAAAGTRVIELRSMYGKVMLSKTVTLVAGVQDVTLDFFIPAGLNLQLGLSGGGVSSGIFTSTTANSNIGYPFSMYSVVRIVGSSLGDKYYPFFYNWDIDVTPKVCNSGARKAVTATVIPRPVPVINGLQAGYHFTDKDVPFTVSPPGGVLTVTGSGFMNNRFYPKLAGVGVHHMNYKIQIGHCSNEVSKDITVDDNVAAMHDGLYIQLFNNPGGRQQLYVVTSTGSPLEVRLLSSSGQLVRKMNFTANAGSNTYPLDVSDLARSIYTLEVRHVASGVKKVVKLLN